MHTRTRSPLPPADPALAAPAGSVPAAAASQDRPRRPAARFAAGGLLATAMIFTGAAAAQAHVEVIPEQTAAGTEVTKIVFRVPTESDTADTTAVRVSLPSATPFAEVLAQPLPGWSVTVTDGTLPKPVTLDGTTLTKAPLTVTWTAEKGQGVKPGQFQEFAVSAGPIPSAGVLSFPVEQTYSDGTSVRWDQPQAPGADEPENPLPSFTVTAATSETSAEPSAGAEPASPKAGTGSGAQADGLARGLGAAGLVAGLAGLAAGLLTRRRATGASA